MEKIITITLNPAIDKSTTAPFIAPEKKIRCASPKFEPGGGGINVSRALKKLGGISTAIFLAGGHTGKFLESLVKQEGIDCLVIPFNGYTRENLIVMDESNDQQYRFGMPGPTVQEKEWRECLNLLKTSDYEYAVISGSNPSGVPPDFYSEAAEIIKHRNAKFIADTSGETLRHALRAGVYLAKPNIGELSSLAGVKELDSGSIVEAARYVISNGKCEVMVVSMGPSGAMLITATEKYYEAAPAIKKKSTVGAGDSMVAGVLWAISEKWAWKEVLRYGIACGTAATINAGTALCAKEDVEKIYSFFQ
jgi:6-phosphofructokinase 2